jgi:hypothetical protein
MTYAPSELSHVLLWAGPSCSLHLHGETLGANEDYRGLGAIVQMAPFLTSHIKHGRMA